MSGGEYTLLAQSGDPAGTAAAAVAAHEADTTSVHGIANTSALVLNTRTLTAGTGLTGGGDLSANRTFAVSYGTSAGTAAEGNDTRITGAASTTYVDDAIAGRHDSSFNGPRPSDYGWLSWTQDPKTVTTTSAALTAGTFYLIRLPVRFAQAISTAWVNCPSAASPTTVEFSLWTPDGTRRAISANAAAQFTGSGTKSINFGTPYTPSAPVDWLWLGVITVGAAFNLTRASGVSVTVLNPNITAANAMFATNGTGLSATPASITPASNTLAAVGEGWWAALS